MPKRMQALPAKNTKEDLITQVYNTKGEVVEKIVLPKEIFAVEVKPALLAQAIRVHLANKRLGTHSTKTRSHVSGSTRKIYRQKGTGRARHGDIKAPIFRGGGIAHGPHPRDYYLQMPKAMRRASLFASLSDKFQDGRVKIISDLEEISAKTKSMVEILLRLKLTSTGEDERHKTLLVIPDKISNILLAGRNLDYLTIEQARLLNAYEVLAHHNLLIMKDAVKKISDTFISNNRNQRDKRDVEQTKIVENSLKVKPQSPRKKIVKLIGEKEKKPRRSKLLIPRSKVRKIIKISK